jgi:hypothetical protein
VRRASLDVVQREEEAIVTYRWTVPDGFVPGSSTGGHAGHESVCVLNATTTDVRLTFTAFFADRDPLVGREVVVAARRACHLRTSEADDIGLELPAEVPYALEIVGDAAVDLQYSRLDTTQPAYTLMTTSLSRSGGPA